MAGEEIKSTVGYARELSTALSDLSLAWAEAADKNKAWTVVSRFTSGSGFWKIQNKIRGVVGGLVVLKESTEAATEAQAKFNDLLGTYAKIRKKVPKMGRDGRMRDAKGQFMSKKAILQTDEAKEKSAIYTKAFGKKEGEARLIADMVKQNKVANDALDKIEDKLAWQLKLQNMTWKERQLARYERAKDKLKNFFNKNGGVLGVMKKVIMFFGKWAIIAPLILVVLVAVLRRAKKWFDWASENLGLWDDVMAWFAALKKVLGGVFDLIKAIWEGDIIGAGIAIFYKILPALFTMFHKALTIGVKVLGAILVGLVAGITQALVDLGVYIKEWVESKGPKAWAGRRWEGGKRAAKSFRTRRMGMRSRAGAMGGIAGERMLVGEAGPEFVTLPFGSQIHSNSQSKRMGGNVININVSGSMGSSDAEIRRLADMLGREINSRMNRTGSIAGRF